MSENEERTKRDQRSVLDYSDPTYPALTEVTNLTDELITRTEQRIERLRWWFYITGVTSIVTSVAVTQRVILEGYLGGLTMDVVGYLLPVMIAVDKFLGMDKKIPMMQEALTSLSIARWTVYSREKEAFTKSQNKPISSDLASELVKDLADARNTAVRKLTEARLAR